jgi:hypothetical protein
MYGMKTLFALLASLIPNDMRMPTFAGNKTGLAKRRPTGAALRNPENLAQAERIRLAAGKRDRKAFRYYKHCISHSRANTAHLHCAAGRALNPFYIAK